MGNASWHSMTEEEKKLRVFSLAMQKCQESYFKCMELNPEMFKEYIQLNKDIMDWIAPQIGMEGFPMYYGPGILSADENIKQTGDDNVSATE